MPSVIFAVGVPIPGEGMGNHAYQIVAGLHRHQMLRRAYVMRYGGGDPFAAQARTAYWTERVAYRLARYLRADQYVLRDNLFDFYVSRQVRNADIFYGWTHHALYSLRAARRRGLITILERANAHPLTVTRLLADEYKRRGVTEPVYHPRILQKHLRELEIADYIAVTSHFTQASLLENGIAEDRILLTPLGVDAARFVPANAPNDGRFRVLYVGQLRLRKGVQYLLEAWARLRLDNAELLLVGDVVDEFKEILHKALRQHANITVVGHAADPVRLYQSASVCVLPTLEDGFGLVVLEAMACGVPVILTENTGAKDCVRRDIDGFILPPYQVEAVAETLSFCARHRDQLAQMGRQARQQAEQFSWTRYQDTLTAHLTRLFHL